MSENKRNIIQKSIHSKANRTYYKQQHTKSSSGCNNCSEYGCYNHSNSGSCNWGVWYDQWGGCSHSAGGYSRCGNNYHGNYCGNHRNTDRNDTVVNYTDSIDETDWNPQAIANTVVLSKAFVNNVKIPTIYCRWSAGSGTEIRPDFTGFDKECTAIRFFLQTSASSSFTNSSFSLLGEVNASESVYNWDVSGLATDASSLYCRIAVVGYNGSWSALLNNGALNVADTREQMVNGGSNPKITVTSFTDVQPSFMLSDTFKIFFYNPPTYDPVTSTWSSEQLTWQTDPWDDKTENQLEAEINKAKGKFDEAAYVFADRPIIENFTFIKSQDLIDAILTMDGIKDASTSTMPTAPTPQTEVNNTAILALQDVLSNLEGK